MRILLTSIGKRVQLIKHLKEENYVVGVDANSLIPARYFVDFFYQIPSYDEKMYINSLLEICKSEKIDMLIPLYEKEFLILDKYRKGFKGMGTLLLLSDKAILEICNDKWRSHVFFEENNIKTPKTYLIEGLDPDGDIRYPVILKPRDGMGSKGIFHAKNRKELINIIEKLDNYIVQEIVEGNEFTMDVLCDLNGRVISIVPRQRLEVRAGEVVKSRALKDMNIINGSLDLMAKLNSKSEYKTIGPLNIQCIVDSNNNIIFIEINPRFGGGVPLSFEAGVDYGKLLNDMISGKEIKPLIGEFRELIMLRYEEAVFQEEI